MISIIVISSGGRLQPDGSGNGVAVFVGIFVAVSVGKLVDVNVGVFVGERKVNVGVGTNSVVFVFLRNSKFESPGLIQENNTNTKRLKKNNIRFLTSILIL